MESHKRLPVSANRLIACCLAAFIFSCNNKPKLINVDAAYSKYIDAYTSGVVSKKNTVRIQLAADASTTHTVNETIAEKLFTFNPAVEGKAYWVDARTIEFKPDKDLQPGQLYEADFKLSFVTKVPTQYSHFKFNVEIVKPSFEVVDHGLKSNNKNTMTYSGVINTADVETSANVEKLLTASFNNNNLKIVWQHNEAAKSHQFVINDIKRGNAAQILSLQWNGGAIQSTNTGKKDITVPAAGDFIVLDVKAMNDDEQYALVQFSDPLATGQMLEGLITVSNTENPSYTILGSEVKVYLASALDGDYSVKVNEGIENMWGDKLKKSYSSNVYFENRMPSVKIEGTGNILPNSSGRLVLPFEATNLKAIDVSIIRIYENNIAQFLQTNNLNGDENLRRVGKPIAEATVKLDDDKTLNLHRKNTFSLDLDKFIKSEPGAIYRVTIGFRPDYSLYSCSEMDKEEEDNYYEDYYDDGNNVDDDQDFWNRYDEYYPYGYDWSNRDNPCSSSYYNREKFESRNILASNLGLTAKLSADKKLFVAVNNIITTAPISNAQLEVLDYQQQVIGKATTNSDGMANIELKRKPYLLIAKQGNEKGYLKLDDGNSLALGRFDVSGEEIKNGIKGFIFGERGVWRPGDSLFLSCIINDKNNPLPKDYPLEMELISPRGQTYKRMVQTNAVDGFNVFRTATDADVPTGNWTCKVKAGGATFEKRIKIETIMPNRLKVNLDFGNLKALGKDATANGTLTARWLFGAPAQNLRATVDAQLYKRTTSFPKYDDYVFDDPTSSYSAQSTTIFDGTLSADGVASINPKFETGDHAPGQLLANLMVKVFEPGGNFSVDNISMPYNPYSTYVGLHVPSGDQSWGYLSTGKTHRFDIVDLTKDGALVNGNSKVEVELYKIQWRWWWDAGDNDEITNFTQDEYNKLLKDDTLTISGGKGSYNVHIDEDGWGRYLILVKDKQSGHTTGKIFYADNDYWWRRNGVEGNQSAAAMLKFQSDKQNYNTGEDVKLTIPSSEGGRALISIESGSKVVKTYWVNTTKGQTKFSFKAEKEMSPNVYVNVSLIQPHAQTVNDLPIRMYGVIPIMVEDKNTYLKPVIKMPDVIRPQTNTNITVSEASGKKMTYVIAVVDEGLLDLTRYKTPDPHAAFFAREALGVKSWDLYDDVIGAWSGELQRILTIGGDAEADLASKTRKANRFPPVVKFMGPYTMSGGSQTKSFSLPAYMGSVKVMVIACDASSGAYGSADKSVTVKKPVMLLATLPRVLGPGEDVKIPVTVFATENNIKNVNLTMQANAFLDGGGSQNVSFSQTGEQMAYFTAHVKNATGVGTIKISASSGKESDAYQTEIEIRNPNPLQTQFTEATLQPGQSYNNAVAMIGDAGSSHAVLEISSIPSINIEKRLKYLITYPHGCIEQTTSSVFPQLYVGQMMDLNDKQKADIDRNVRLGIQRLLNFQTPDGGFSYWPGEGTSNEWGSNYAGHFLLAASAKGYIVPQSMLSNWKQYERSKALAWNVTEAPWYGTDLSQAYRLYLLALAGAPELGAMNRLKEWKFISPEAKWRLAAAYHLAGQSKIAVQMIANLPVSFAVRTSPGFTFGSDLRDQAMVLESLTVMGRNAEAANLVRTVAAKLSQEDWYSTQTTAYSLLAIGNFCGSNKNYKRIIVKGKVGNSSLNINSTAYASQTGVDFINGKASVSVTNSGNNVLYLRFINEGKPVSNENITYQNNPNILQLSVSYVSKDGKPLDVANIKQGTDFVAKVTVKNPGMRGQYTEMALSQIFPSGWEILNTRLYNSEGAYQNSPYDYMDIRDDRVYFYFDMNAGQSLTYYVQLNAAYPGKYFWPGVYCEAMYDHTISAGVSGKWVTVSEP